MEQIRDVAERLEMPGGVHVVEPNPEELKKCIADGNRFIAYGVDTRMLDVACRLGLAGLKN